MLKKVVSAYYGHKSNLKELRTKVSPEDLKDFDKLIDEAIKNNIDFTIIKYDKGNVTLISSPDWDSANEPIVGMCYRWNHNKYFTDGKLTSPKIMKNFKQIYHNKWQFVDENYTGFNIEQAKQRTLLWNSIPNIDKKRIGYKKYWINLLKKNNILV